MKVSRGCWKGEVIKNAHQNGRIDLEWWKGKRWCKVTPHQRMTQNQHFLIWQYLQFLTEKWWQGLPVRRSTAVETSDCLDLLSLTFEGLNFIMTTIVCFCTLTGLKTLKCSKSCRFYMNSLKTNDCSFQKEGTEGLGMRAPGKSGKHLKLQLIPSWNKKKKMRCAWQKSLERARHTKFLGKSCWLMRSQAQDCPSWSLTSKDSSLHPHCQ